MQERAAAAWSQCRAGERSVQHCTIVQYSTVPTREPPTGRCIPHSRVRPGPPEGTEPMVPYQWYRSNGTALYCTVPMVLYCTNSKLPAEAYRTVPVVPDGTVLPNALPCPVLHLLNVMSCAAPTVSVSTPARASCRWCVQGRTPRAQGAPPPSCGKPPPPAVRTRVADAPPNR